MQVIKKDGTIEEFDKEKIINAVRKSASRCTSSMISYDYDKLIELVNDYLLGYSIVKVAVIHDAVIKALYKINSEVAETYSHYHNYKTDFVKILDETYKASQSIRYIGDKENSNTDSALVATKRCLIFNELNKRLYRKFFMRHDELEACKDGYIYIHDQSARLDTINCCLFDVANVMRGGFEMGNIHYNEPKTLDTAFDVLGDIILSCASQQYGGFTVPEIDKILKPYAEKSYTKYRWECLQLCGDLNKSHEWAMGKVKRDFEQGYQGLEMKLNSVGSSRGDYPFITISFGLGVEHFERMCTQTILEVHAKGQGADGHKKPVLFPKLVFLYDSTLHGEGYINNDLFECALECSSKTMYPDYLSLERDEMYQKYGVAISPMGCFKGDHVLGFMQQDIPFAQSIERTWDWLSSTVPVKTQIEGQPHKYIDVSNLNFKVWDTAKQDYVKVNTFIRNVQDNWVNVKLSNGRYLDVTSDHPFETENRGVVQAKDLVLGDKIKANYGAPTFTESGEINNSLAWLYGAMLCDGCYQNYSVFASFGVDEEDVIDKFIGAFQENYKLAPEVKLQKRGKKGTYYDVRVKSSLTHSLKSLINEFTSVFGGVQKIYRHIPSFIWNSNRENKLHFLAGMFDADGSIRYDDGLASLGSTNHELAYEQMYLIQSLGMPCKIRKNYYKGKQNSDKYRVAIDFYPTAELIECLTSQKKVNNFAGEKHFKNIPDVVEVIGLDMVEGTDYAYDLSTESAHFEVNGIYSHNCRAFLSPWYKKGGMTPADGTDKPVFVGRFNMGVVSLHLPMILAKARKENKDFYEVLDFYLEMIRRIHKRTIDYLGEMRASTNPVGFCEGGFYGGHLKPSDKIKPLLKAMTISFGITALNELQRLYNGKSLVEDGAFALEVMEHINRKIEQYKKEDGILYAIYGTPAESLCFTGDTVVQAYDGNKQIKDVKVGDLVYSYNEHTKKIELNKVVKTMKSDKPVLKVNFDNGQSVICTLSHPFAVRKMKKDKMGKITGEYIEYIPALNLKKGDRIKSNYITVNTHGRLKCTGGLIQDINAEYAYGEKPNGYVVHHINKNKLDNRFENLTYIKDSEHRKLHAEDTIKNYCFKSDDVTGEKNNFYGKHHTEYAKNQNRIKHMGRSIDQLNCDGVFIAHYECIGDVKNHGYTEHLVRLACKGDHKYKNSLWYYSDDLEKNHRVLSVELLDRVDTVYNIEVENNHNYYVGGDAGVLVHNCGKQVEQFRKLYGIVEGVSDRAYVSNSFHCHVTEDISPIMKQDLEGRFWHLFKGGRIQYVRYPLSYNIDAIRTLVTRAMKKGFYEGVNMALAYCDDCGADKIEGDVCPVCGSKNLTKIDRMNGYLSYSRVKGDTRLNSAKMAEIADRKSC